MFIYGYIKEAYKDNDYKHDYVYGIELCCEKGGALIQLNYISNVFTDEASAKAFVDLCNRLELSPVHFYDVIEDMISS